MLIGGAAWILFISLFNVLILTHTPDWVRARVLSGVNAGISRSNGGWQRRVGHLATRTNIHVALVWAGAGTIATTALGLFLKLPDATIDLTPWVHWRLPTIMKEDPTADDAGPILVTVEYDVDPEQKVAFIKAMHKYGRIRRRDGAFRWGIFQDLENPDRYVETFLVDSWAEHARQHERRPARIEKLKSESTAMSAVRLQCDICCT